MSHLTSLLTGKFLGKRTDALKDALDFKYKKWSAGVILSFPLNNAITKTNYSNALLELEQAELRLKNLEQQSKLESKNTFHLVETNYQRVLAYKLAREIAEKSPKQRLKS